MGLVIKKFGGTSVGGLERIAHVASLVREYKKSNPEDQVVVVVSAMAGETNELVDLAKRCSASPEPREMAVLLSTGEQRSMALLAMKLCELGVPARSLDAQQAHIETDRHHLNAQIEKIDCSRLTDTLQAGAVPVIAGFQGIDTAGDITTLGRGGSDITAVALAAALKADGCYIYTDVEGVFTTDPRICREARHIEKLCHEEMLEMASLGAKVLHPRSVYFAMRYHVPLVVLSTFKPKRRTWIVKEEELMEKPVVSGITYRMDEAKLTIRKMPGGIKSLSEIFSALAKENIFIDMITQTGVIDGKTNISFTVPNEVSDLALELVQGAVPALGAEGAFLERDIAKVSIVGIGMRYHGGVAAKMFEVLSGEGIDCEMISTSEIKMSVLIPRKYCEMAVRSLHEAFIEMQPEVSVEQ